MEAKTPSNKNEINAGAGNLEHAMELLKGELKELKLEMHNSFDYLDKDKKKNQKINKTKFVQKQILQFIHRPDTFLYKERCVCKL